MSERKTGVQEEGFEEEDDDDLEDVQLLMKELASMKVTRQVVTQWLRYMTGLGPARSVVRSLL